MSNHTTGQWRYFFNGQYHEVKGTDKMPPYISIFTTSRNNHPNFDEIDICEIAEAEANAKLIAAAPELLEALKKLIDRGEIMSDTTELKSLIQKATT